MTKTPFFTDHNYLKQWHRDQENILLHGNKTLQAYESVTGFKVEMIKDFALMVSDPETFYRAAYYQANRKDFQLLEKLNLDLSELIKLPENFSELEEAASRFTRELRSLDWKYFDIVKGRFVHSDLAILKRDSRAIHFANTSEEKARLQLCEKLISFYSDLEGQLKKELKPTRFSAMLEGLYHFKPTPFQLVIAPNESGKLKLWPNPKFVRQSFKGSATLGFYWPTEEEAQRAIKDAERIEAARPKAVQETRYAVNDNYFSTLENIN